MNKTGITNPSSILVTGATGFVGQQLCSYLLAKGYQVRGTFRHSSKILEQLPDVEWIQVTDIGPSTNWHEILTNVHYVVHLAALAHQLGKKGEGRYAEFMAINAEGSAHLAQAVATSTSVKRLILLSSIGVVKSLSNEIITETTPCIPDTDYGRSKFAGEKRIQEILKDTQVDWCILRPPLVYGPSNPGNMARLLKLIHTGLPLPLGGVNNQRSFVYVGNLIEAIERCLWHPGASRRTFFISDREVVSTVELLDMLAQKANKPLRLFTVPRSLMKGVATLGDLLSQALGRSVGIDSYSLSRLLGSLYVDSSPLYEALEWSPPFTLAQGIEATLHVN
jgi:nucleoside-diphosphate-sugar epimerase